ncbi:hypothetical protein [Lactococcus lactis]|uniref:hypothetical protein n=1 Tax=Lactococcus lactis TaxID=1358 RepID=UPI003F277CDE
MEKDYLTSLFIDDSFKNTLEIARNNHENIIRMINPTLSLIDSLPISKVYESIIPNLPILAIQEIQSEEIKKLTSQFQDYYKASFQAQEIAKRYSKLIETSGFNIKTFNFSKALPDFESLIKEIDIDTQQEENQSTTDFVTTSSPKDNRTQNKNDIKNLSVAINNLQHASYSLNVLYSHIYTSLSERQLTLFLYAESFDIFVQALTQISNPYMSSIILFLLATASIFLPSPSPSDKNSS